VGRVGGAALPLLRRVGAGPLFALAFLASGLVSLLVHAELPIVRNSLVYAKIAYAMSDLGTAFDGSLHAYNKAVGFSYLSYPLVQAFGANAGLKVATFVWTSAWVVSLVLFFLRLRRSFAIGPDVADGGVLLALVVCLLNPVVFYQFVSAYPDTLNALMILWAMFLLDRGTSDDRRRFDAPLFALVCLVAIWIKHHGFVLLAIAAIFGLCRAAALGRRWREDRADAWGWALSIAGLLLVLALAQRGLVPTFNLSHNTDNYARGFGRMLEIVGRNGQMTAVAAGLMFGVLCPLLFRWRSVAQYREWYLAVALFVASLVGYHGAGHNPRYYLPIAPLLAWIIVGNLARLEVRPRRALLAAFIVVQLFTTTYYNSFEVRDRLQVLVRLPRVDNLRLTFEQRKARRALDAIHRHASGEQRTLFFVASYYGDTKWAVWKREGLLPTGMPTIYLAEPDWPRMRAVTGERGQS
jgi:hypothetical protein